MPNQYSSMRDQMEAAENEAARIRSLRRDYEARTPLISYQVTSGKIHLGRASFSRSGYTVIACSGRSVIGAIPTSQAPTCKLCQAKS
jgi:hypothetical protein